MATGSDPATNSAWGVPVYCPGTTDPCLSASAPEQTLGWRWNLDYVVDPQGNLTVYDYQQETNYYSMGGGQNGGNGTLTQYVRGGSCRVSPTGGGCPTLWSPGPAGRSDPVQVIAALHGRGRGVLVVLEPDVHDRLGLAGYAVRPDLPVHRNVH